MKKSLLKILIALIAILLLPLILFVFFEYTKMNDNERLIKSVYENQLESIISSINAYGQDVAVNWASRIELSMKYPTDSSLMNRLLNENQSINGIFVAYDESTIVPVYQSSLVAQRDTISKLLVDYSKNIQQLKEYLKNKYRKFLTIPYHNHNVFIIFIGEDSKGKPLTCIIQSDIPQFLQNHIHPRMQSIAQDQFNIALKQKSTGRIILSSGKENTNGEIFDKESEMWILPDISIGISLKNQTINDLAKSRIKEGLYFLLVALVVIVAGIWFLYSNVKREIQLAQIKSEFISNVSHEIRTPLALISMYIETLEMGRIKTEEKVQEYYVIIRSETQRLTDMVNKILGFAKIERGKRQFSPKICNLNGIVQQVYDSYHFHVTQKGFKFQYAACDNLPFINGDKEAITESIINLIDNAVKYSRENKQIDLITGISQNQVFIEVKDQGIGISKKNQKLIFDKFFRVTHRNLANEVKGTGLGLSIVREIVKAHHGKVTLTSKPGEGSSFRLYFPVYNG